MALSLNPPPLPDEVDGVFVGGGHNALVAAAYLARAGLSVLVLEAGQELGGGVTTAEITLPLFRHNLHAFFVRWTPDYRIWGDLDLDRYGVHALYPEVQNGLPYDGGERALLIYRDLERSVEQIRRLDARDADTYARLHGEFSDLTARLLAPLRFAAPLHPDTERELLSRSRTGRRYLELAERPALDLLHDWFTSEPLRALMDFQVALRGYLPVMDLPGTGYIAALALPAGHETRMIEGGSAQMTGALAAAVYDAGGRIATRSPVAHIDVRDGRARGVETADGRTVTARRFVASSVPAPLTLLEMVGHEHLDPSLADALRSYRWLEEALYGVHVAMRRRPRFTAESDAPDLPRALNLVLGYETSADVLRDLEAVRAKELPEASALHASIPSANDPTQAPPGCDTFFGWQFVPSGAADGMDRWDDAANRAQVKSMLDCYARYAPDLADHLLAAEAHSPTHTQALVPSMPGGDRHHGSYHPDNWAALRPHADLSGYRAPVDGLYLCGSAQHPGGSFTGSPGFIAAGVIADDVGADVWWQRSDARAVIAALD